MRRLSAGWSALITTDDEQTTPPAAFSRCIGLGRLAGGALIHADCGAWELDLLQMASLTTAKGRLMARVETAVA